MTTQGRADPSRRAWPLFALAVLVGLGLLGLFAEQAWRDVRISWFYRPATCTVLSSSVYESTSRWSQAVTRSSSHPRFSYELQVDGRRYTAVGFDNMDGSTSHPAETLSFKTGQAYPCWYDPANPEQAVLKRQVFGPLYALLAVPLLFVLVGGNMLFLALRPVAPVALPGLDAGDALAVRLRPELTGRQAAGCLAAVAIAGTAGVVAFFAFLVRSRSLLSGDGLTTLALFAAAVDGFVIYHLVRTLRGLGLPDPVVEIEREPLHPGEKARLLVRQPGPARFDAFRVSVLCEEQGGRGTRQSHRKQLVNKQGVEVALAGDLVESLTIEIPADASTSLKELQTIVTWKIVVQRKRKLVSADAEFVFRVLPSPGA
jgi:hypothetical protein